MGSISNINSSVINDLLSPFIDKVDSAVLNYFNIPPICTIYFLYKVLKYIGSLTLTLVLLGRRMLLLVSETCNNKDQKKKEKKKLCDHLEKLRLFFSKYKR